MLIAVPQITEEIVLVFLLSLYSVERGLAQQFNKIHPRVPTYLFAEGTVTKAFRCVCECAFTLITCFLIC